MFGWIFRSIVLGILLYYIVYLFFLGCAKGQKNEICIIPQWQYASQLCPTEERQDSGTAQKGVGWCILITLPSQTKLEREYYIEVILSVSWSDVGLTADSDVGLFTCNVTSLWSISVDVCWNIFQFIFNMNYNLVNWGWPHSVKKGTLTHRVRTQSVMKKTLTHKVRPHSVRKKILTLEVRPHSVMKKIHYLSVILFLKCTKSHV